MRFRGIRTFFHEFVWIEITSLIPGLGSTDSDPLEIGQAIKKKKKKAQWL